MMMRTVKVIAAVALLGLLGSCYLPNKFDLTMQVAPDGRYAMRYDGTLTQLQFLQRIGTGELQGAKVDEYVTIYENEMRRNSGFKEVTYLGNAEYQVKFDKQGSLAEEKQFSFPVRRGVIVGLRHWTAQSAAGYMDKFKAMNHPALAALAQAGFQNEPNIMEIFGDRLPDRLRQDLKANGFWIRGTIRIWTSAKVGYNNADQVIPGNPAQYIWTIDSLDHDSPHMIMAWTPPKQ